MQRRAVAATRCVFLCLLVGLASVPPARAQQTVPIIDVHAHLVPDPGLDFRGAVQHALAIMDQFGVARTILMSPPRVLGIAQNHDTGQLRPAVEGQGDRFVLLAGGGTLNPKLHGKANPASVTRADLDAVIAEANTLIDGGALGFGEMSALHVSLSQQHGYTYVTADHPILLALADVAAARDVPIDLHMDALGSDSPPPKALAAFPNNPARFPATLAGLARLLAHNSRAKIVWAHAGTDHLGDLTPRVVGRLMDEHPNLFMSLKVSGPRAQVKNKLLDGARVDRGWLALLKRHSDRFVIGTDNFYAGRLGRGPTMAFSEMVEPRMQITLRFLSLLPAAIANRIGHENAIKLYNLPPLAPAAFPTGQQEIIRKPSHGLCKDGNLEHCRIVCSKGVRQACQRLKRGQ